ncbi:hypothetical protein GCM10028857_06070 [Salinarchaeum chitinilyticum]
MVEKADRDEVGAEPRGDPSREWEVFVRDDADEPLGHVGSVSAQTAEIANEQASRLFAWYADDLWLCPADEVRRFSTHDLDDDEREATDSNGDAPTDVVDEDDTEEHDAEDEPRVTEL